MEFDFKKYNGKYAMHCKTEKEADDFCGAMQRNGMKWRTGTPYSMSTNYHEYGPETCYSFNEGEYCHKSLYVDEGYEILEWSDFIEKTEETGPVDINKTIKIIDNANIELMNRNKSLEEEIKRMAEEKREVDNIMISLSNKITELQKRNKKLSNNLIMLILNGDMRNDK